VNDVTERAWLKNFIDGWLARMPMSVRSEAAE
jgi:GMP synthase (glutamine-hydrolysing)